MGPKIAEARPFEGGDVRSEETNLWRTSGFECFLPPRRTKTPLITSLQTDESVFGMRCREIVASGFAERKKFVGHDGADRVDAHVFTAGVTTAVAVKARQGIEAAQLQLGAEHVLRHPLTLRHAPPHMNLRDGSACRVDVQRKVVGVGVGLAGSVIARDSDL